jgi:drug/metabolite transporter (DMT)-like permease
MTVSLSGPRRPGPTLVLVATTVLWASTFVVTKHAVAEVGPLAFTALRFGLATLLLVGGGLAARRLGPFSRRLLVDGMVLAGLNAAGLVFQVFGQVYTTASKSSFITSLNTPLTPLVGLLLYRSRPTRAQLVGVVLASLGVVVLTWPGVGARYGRGDLYTLACAILYALTIVEYGRRAPRHAAFPLTVVLVAGGAVIFATLWGAAQALLHVVPAARLPEPLLIEARPFPRAGPVLYEVGYMALFCTALAFTVQTWAIARMTATRVAIVFALEPLLATALALIVDGSAEWPGPRGAVGAAGVMLGVLVSEARPEKDPLS